MDDATRGSLIADVAAVIEGQKDEVIAAIRSEITSYIGGKRPSECLALVQRDDSGSVFKTLPMEANSDYARALISFVRDKPYNGYRLDSALTDPTSSRVADVFAKTIGDKADDIAARALPALISDKRFVDGLSASIVGLYSSTLPQQVQKMAVKGLSTKLSSALSQSIDTTTVAAVKLSVAKIAAASVASPLATQISLAIIKTLGVVLKPIIVKLLASSAFKAAIVAKLKAIIVASILGAFVKIIGVKLGLSAGATFMIFLIPVLLAWIAYEISSFPEKLSSKVANGVAEDLSGNFAKTSLTMAETLIEKMIVESVGIVATELMANAVIVDAVKAAVDQAS